MEDPVIMTRASVRRLGWWMRIVGCFYLFLFIPTAILKLPIKTLAPEGTLEKAASGDGVAGFLVDTWVILGLALSAIGISLLIASRHPAQSKSLVRTVILFELIWGIFSDLYQLWRGHPWQVAGTWIVIHLIIITTGLLFLRKMNNQKS